MVVQNTVNVGCQAILATSVEFLCVWNMFSFIKTWVNVTVFNFDFHINLRETPITLTSLEYIFLIIKTF